MDEVYLKKEPVNLIINSSYCVPQCTDIISHIAGYIEESSDTEEFVLAVIDLKEYNGFDDFLAKAISSKRRNEYRKAISSGLSVRLLSVQDRNDRREELYAINISATERQGEMSEEYFQYPPEVDESACRCHYHKTYGVFTPGNEWIGYVYLRFCGEFTATFRILGHAAYFNKGNFMLFLMLKLIQDLYLNHPEIRYLNYHLMYVGKPGLQEWKKNAGFKPTRFVGGVNN